jgi:hemin uptake protein HemP
LILAVRLAGDRGARGLLAGSRRQASPCPPPVLILLIAQYIQVKMRLNRLKSFKTTRSEIIINKNYKYNSDRDLHGPGKYQMNADDDHSKYRAVRRDTGADSGVTRSVRLVENRINSGELFAATREITIAHGTDVYRLRLTAQNKLILTK